MPVNGLIRNIRIDVGGVVLERSVGQDDLLTFAGAGTVKAGTILARHSSTQRLIPYVKGGNTNGNGIPKAVLTYPVTATGPGDEPVRALIAGKVNARRLVIHADGDAENIDAAVLDALRATGIVAVRSQQLGRYDNPQDEPLDS